MNGYLARHGLLIKDEAPGTALFDMIGDLVAEDSTTSGSPSSPTTAKSTRLAQTS